MATALLDEVLQDGPIAVAVPGKFYLNLHYTSPTPVPVGARVKVTLRNKPCIGVVLAHGGAPENVRLKPITEVIDQSPLLDHASLKLLRWASSYYAHPQGDVICSSLPTLLAQGEPATVSSETQYGLSSTAPNDAETQLARAKNQLALFQHLASGEYFSAQDLKQRGHKPAALKALTDKGFIASREAHAQCLGNPSPTAGPELNSEQQQAVDAINNANDRSQCFVLQGITGSGKTEVYLQATLATLARGQSALILVPEIGLTPQFINRVQARVGAAVTVLHSGLSHTQRKDHWLFAQSGQAKVIIGTRSAIFAPIPALGLIVVDEEHDPAFKQQEQMRYHARDLAILRAHQANIPIVLGSATPASETIANLQRGNYQLLTLTQRATGQRLPAIKAIDLRSQSLRDYLSQALINRVKHHLEQGNQVMIFLNRRGVAPVLLCHECGWSADCPSCDSRMTLHRGQYRDVLRCHHCNRSQAAPQNCQSCGSGNLISAGAGTAGLEETLSKLFPQHSVLRVDRDNTKNSKALHQALEQAAAGKADVLVGTQMLAKGHHFPKLTLVGIVDADAGLYSSDYRAPERLAQQVIQVAGRAGREAPGEVLIQTHMPDHPLLQALLQQGYDQAIGQLLDDRKQMALPPYSFMALVRLSHPYSEKAEAFGRAIAALCNEIQPSATVLGPITAPMPRKANRWRFQVLIQTSSRSERSALLQQLVPAADQHKLASGVRWSVDVDPLDLF